MPSLGLLVALLYVGGSSCATTMSSREVARAFPARRYTLPSGLRVVVEEDPSASLVGVVWVVDAGAIDDPAHHGELAHIVEHLAFQLPVTVGQSPWQRLVDLGATGVNGATGFETTTFMSFAPRTELDHLLAIELGRMADPLGSSDDAALATALAKESRVLREESNVRDDALRAEATTFAASVFRAPHPFASANHQLEPGDVIAPVAARTFARANYRPEKMTLVVSGPIPAVWDAQLLSRMPPSLAGDRTAPRAPMRRSVSWFGATPPPGGRPDLDRVGSRVSQPYLRIGWWLPGVRAVDGVPERILGQVVDMALDWAVQSGELLDVLAAHAETQVNQAGSLLECRILLGNEGRAEKVRARTVEIVTQQAFNGFRLYGAAQRTALQRVKLEAVLELEDLKERTLHSARLAHADWSADIGAMVQAVNGISDGQLSDLAERYLTPAASRASLFHATADPQSKPAIAPASPGGGFSPAGAQGELPASAAEPPSPQPSASHSAEQVRRAAAVSPLIGARVVHLRNGLTVIALRRPGPSFVSMLLGFHSAPSADAPSGVWRAARFGRGYTNMWGPLDSGILVRTLTGGDETGAALSTYAWQAGAALDYLANRTSQLEVHWPDDDFLRWTEIAGTDERSIDGRTRLRFLRTLWPNGTYGWQVPVMDVMERTEAQVKTWIARVERPENGALVIVGNVDPDRMVSVADGDLRGAWDDPPANAARLLTPQPVLPRPRVGPLPIQFNQVPAQRAASIAFGCFLPPARTPRDGIIGDLLGELLNQYLFDRLRLHEGKTYSEAVVHSQLWGGTSVLDGHFDIEDGSVAEGTSVIQSCLTEGGQSFLDPDSIERVRWKVALARAAQFSSNDDVMRALFDAWKLGWSPAMLDDVPAQLVAVSVSDLEAALRTCRASAVVSVTAAVAMH